MRPTAARLPLAFGVFGVLWGAWQAVLPDLAAQHGLSSGPLGAILTLGFAASLPAMIAAGRLLDRAGAGWAIAVPAVAMALALLAIAAVPSIAVLVVAVVVFASGSGAYDVAINGAAMGDKAWSRPGRLTLLHAAFSGGGVVGAVGGGLTIGSGIAFQAVYLVLAVALVLMGAAAVTPPWRGASTGGAVPRSVGLAMLPLAALAGLAFLAEGSMETWSAIYLRDVLGAAALVGALGPAAFHGAMFVGRLVGAGVAGWLGAPTTLLVGGLMTLLGMAAALLVTEPAAAIPGMAVAALGASFVVPVVVSLAARRAGAHAGRAASYVLTLGYAGFLVGPSLVGIGGELVGLRAALVVVPVAAALIAVGSRTSVARG
ncbi:MAG: MFS transporter [Candidatus Limnocylindria bacterium]